MCVCVCVCVVCVVCDSDFTVRVSLPSLWPAVRNLKEELQQLQEQGSHVGEVVKPMDKQKVLVKVPFTSCAVHLASYDCSPLSPHLPRLMEYQMMPFM